MTVKTFWTIDDGYSSIDLQYDVLCEMYCTPPVNWQALGVLVSFCVLMYCIIRLANTNRRVDAMKKKNYTPRV